MSGGPYGRGKAPERACLPVDRWPETDRLLWLASCAEGDPLDEEVGARSQHAEISNAKAAKGYGRWLTHLSPTARETLDETSAARITPDRVRTYVDLLHGIGNSAQTILARLQELGEVAKVIDNRGDWSFINRMASKVRARHRPARDKTHLRPSNELVDLGFNLMQAAEGLDGLEAAIAHRDGLLIGFLALVPLRRRNLADLVIDRTLLREGANWTVAFGEDDTKTHGAFEIGVPHILKAPLEVVPRATPADPDGTIRSLDPAGRRRAVGVQGWIADDSDGDLRSDSGQDKEGVWGRDQSSPVPGRSGDDDGNC